MIFENRTDNDFGSESQRDRERVCIRTMSRLRRDYDGGLKPRNWQWVPIVDNVYGCIEIGCALIWCAMWRSWSWLLRSTWRGGGVLAWWWWWWWWYIGLDLCSTLLDDFHLPQGRILHSRARVQEVIIIIIIIIIISCMHDIGKSIRFRYLPLFNFFSNTLTP
jgi:hypothetical protein